MAAHTTPDTRVAERLYEAVALGMWAYTRSAFRVIDLGAECFRPRRGVLLVSSHRAETDVPLLCPTLYARGGLRDRSRPRIHFAARDDMFDGGFFASFPPRLPMAARRLLYPLAAGRLLRRVRVHPVPYPSASLLRLGRALAELPPEAALGPLIPAELAARLDARAHEIRAIPPRTAGEALRGEYADLLWELCTREQLADPVFEPGWRRRAEEATAAIRGLIEIIGSREVLLLFPEGRPSPDGALGPLRKGLATLVRRGRPEVIAPIAVAYDPLTIGRTRAYVAFGAEFPPPAEGVEDAVLDALKRTTPLTCGQVVACELLRAASSGVERVAARDIDAVLAAGSENAATGGRPVDPALLVPSSRRARLTDAFGWVIRSGLAAASDHRTLVLEPGRILADQTVLRAAGEYASARRLIDNSSINRLREEILDRVDD